LASLTRQAQVFALHRGCLPLAPVVEQSLATPHCRQLPLIQTGVEFVQTVHDVPQLFLSDVTSMQFEPPHVACPLGQLVAQPGVPLVVQPNMQVIGAGVDPHAPLPLHVGAAVAFPPLQAGEPQVVLPPG